MPIANVTVGLPIHDFDQTLTAPFRLSMVQQGVWFDQMHHGQMPHNIGLSVLIEGTLHISKLKKAINIVARQNDALRLVTHYVDGIPSQRIVPEIDVSLPVIDFSALPNADSAALAHIEQEFQRPFRLEGDLLFSFQLVRVSPSRSYWLQRYDQLITDRAGVQLTHNAIVATYRQLLTGNRDIDSRGTSYQQVIADEAGYIASERFSRDEEFWRDRFSTLPTGLFSQRTTSASPSLPAQREEIVWRIERPLFNRALEHAQAAGCTKQHLMLALVSCYFARVSGETDIVIGVPIPNRHSSDLKKTAGTLASVLPLRIEVDLERRFEDLLKTISSQLRLCQKHQRLPISEINRCSDLSPVDGENLYDIVVSFDNDRFARLECDGQTKVRRLHCGFGHPPLAISVNDSGGRRDVSVVFEFSRDRLNVDEVKDAQARIAVLLDSVLSEGDVPIQQLPLLSSSERHQILVDWNGTETRYEKETCVHELFEAQVRRSPDAIALMHEDQSLSYGGLNAKANRLAHYLRELGVGADTRVAVCLERGVEMVVALLAILKAGGAYVPLDPNYPVERLVYMLEDAQALVLLTQQGFGVIAAKAPVECINLDTARGLIAEESAENLGTTSDPDNLAYVIYTSGSTGQPKGVAIAHRSAVAFLNWAHETFPEDLLEGLLASTSICFDLSIFEMFLPLCFGGRMILADNVLATPELAARMHITLMNTVPSAMRELLNSSGLPPSVRIVNLAGEPFPADLATRLHQESLVEKLYNLYGPSETTTYSTVARIADDGRLPTIGGPIANTRVYVLDECLNLAGIGVPGDLYISGYGLARGYLHRAEPTAEKFMPDPYAVVPGVRMYRTGDRARWLADGNLEFMGRIDQQVKVRGYRIELGEIEAALRSHPEVREAAVLAREDGEAGRQLVAYYTGTDIGVAALRGHVSSALPEYMVPSAYVRLEVLPLTPNGKLDRRALPAPQRQAYVRRGYQAPVGEIEIQLARIWGNVLKLERVGRNDNFYELGGHSLLAVTVIERMRREGLQTDVRTLFMAPTLRALAEAVGRGDHFEIETPPNLIPPGCRAITPEMLTLVELVQSEIDGVVAGVPGGASNVQDIYPLAPLQEGILFHHLMSPRGDTYLLQGLLAFDARDHLDGFVRALRAVIARHDILRTAVVWEDLREPVQVVWREAPLTVDEVVLDPSGVDAGEQLWERFHRRGIQLDVRRAPLMRCVVAHDSANRRWLLLWLAHHLAIDHTTLEIMVREAQAHVLGEVDRLPEPLPFRNFVAQARLGIPQAEHEAFFRRMLGDVEEPTAPFGLLEAHGDGSNVEEARLELDSILGQRLRERARGLGVSAASLCHLAWARVLARVSGSDDVVFGTVLFGRMQGGEGADRTLGLFINTLPIRIDVGDENVEFSVRHVHALLADLMRHEHASLALAQRCSAVVAPTPLFTSLLNYVHSTREVLKSAEAEMVEAGIAALESEERTNYPLMLEVDDLGDGFSLTAQTALTLIDPARVCEYMQTALERLVEALETAAETQARAIDVLPESERHRVLEQWNSTEADYPTERCIHELFEAQVKKSPDDIALVHDEQSWTYGELNARANRLAHRLREFGVEPGARVAILLERSMDLVIAELATLKCGAAYVPIDPEFPAERQVFMAFDCGAWLAITTRSATLSAGLTIPRVDIDELNQVIAGGANLNIPLNSEMPAYVMYTSGSTGKPKGVIVAHRSIGRLVLNCGYADFNETDRVAFAANPAFDAATMEVWAPLLNGGRIVVVDRQALLDSKTFARLLVQRGVTTLFLTTAIFNQYALAIPEALAGLRFLLCGGERNEPSSFARVLEQGGPEHLIHCYGPTETTTFAITHEVTEVPAGTDSIPLGRPISNTQIYILSAGLQPAPTGVTGELYIGGVGVAQGYLNRPELTAERFLPNPFRLEPGEQMYRTGDQGRWLATGEIEFEGRNDFQVKIRGFRVEMGEIEAILAGHPQVREVVVLAHEDGERGKALVAYYTGEQVEVEALRDHLASGLPEYMVPPAYVYLKTLPLTPTGKIDRRALPAPEIEAYVTRDYEAPIGETETRLAGIWADLLRLERVGRRDNFFELGGHSLLAVQVVSQLRQKIAVEVPLRDLFAHPQLADFALTVKHASQAALPPISPMERNRPLEVSFAQQRLWFLTQFEGASEAYHIPIGLRLIGDLDRAALRRALDRIVRRHEPLRTTFSRIEGRLVQVIGSVEDGFHLEEHDLRDSENAESELSEFASREATEPFDLERGPLLRGRLVQLDDDDHALLLTMHHIVSDGWSMGVLTDELSVLYKAYRNGAAESLPELPVQYADYAAWQRRLLTGEVWRRQAEYWKKTLAGAPPILELPTDRARATQQDYAGDAVQIELEEDLTGELKALSQRHGVTLYMTLLAGWAALLGRLSGQDEVLIGTPVANRTRSEIEPLIGFFVNTLALRIDLSGSPTVGELLERVKLRTLEAQEHQDIPFEQVVEITQPVRSLSHAPVFQAMFAWQNTPEGALELSGLSVTRLDAATVSAPFDLTLALQETAQRIVGGMEYATALFDRATVVRFLGYWQKLLKGMVEGEGRVVDRMALLGETERCEVLAEWNATDGDYPSEKCIHELFEQEVEQAQDAIALVCGQSSVSYGELNARANRLSHQLRELGVGPDVRVGICMERSVEMVVALLATLKAGGAYVPLDPAYPRERLAYMLEDSAPAVLATHDAAMGALAGHSGVFQIVNLDSDAAKWAGQSDCNPGRAEVGLDANQLAYVIYTSGSTGRPKGVLVTHRGLVHSTTARLRYYSEPITNFMLVSAFTFDSSVAGIFGTLCQGGTLTLAAENFQYDIDGFADSLGTHYVSHLLCIPTLYDALLEQSSRYDLSTLRVVIVAGETCSRRLVNDHHERLAHVALYNEYGPTEATVWSTVEECHVAEPHTAVLIGRPIPNTQIHVLDKYSQPSPWGVAGELYLGGEGVARGYLNRPELTAEKFLPDPFGANPGGRLYRTGDLGRWLTVGKIDFLGRRDHQVKIRGFRIELGEIETALSSHPGVSKAVVLARDSEEGKRLVSYYTGEKIEAEALRSHISSGLPAYMLPSAYVYLDALPLTPNGKLDRQALPIPEGEAYLTRGYDSPVGETEIRLARIWADLLKLEAVGRRDNFFELGGHSLMASMLILRIKNEIGVTIGLPEVFNLPELALLSEHIVNAQLATFDAAELAEMAALL